MPRVHETEAAPSIAKLHGYGVRWDREARLYRVRNELTGEWLRGSDGALCGFSSFSVAEKAWRGFESHRVVA
ncbi:hypothetical protein [Kitasatospora sp. NPDC088351]|uniref:hypothetical protein n=1 Tax=unclassified Kitasatospora TaxID=2633591 RepID=UPI0034484446